MGVPDYAELQVTTNFTFLEGASHPDELVVTARALGHSALAVTDRNSVAGVVRAHKAARDHGLRLVVGCRLDLDATGGIDGPGRPPPATDGANTADPGHIDRDGADGSTGDAADGWPRAGRPGQMVADGPHYSLLCYPSDRAAYGRLCRLLTRGRRRAGKGDCRITLADLAGHAAGQVLAVVPPPRLGDLDPAVLRAVRDMAGDRAYLVASPRFRGDDAARFDWLAARGADAGLPLLATNDVLYHTPGRRALQDVLACVRNGCTLDTAGARLQANRERHLKAPAEMARLFCNHPAALAAGRDIVDRCAFSLDALRYDHPVQETGAGRTPHQELEHLTWLGAASRYPDGVPPAVRAVLHHELGLIGRLGYAPYFLTVAAIVRFARDRGILCQGRGSAANSAVCYVLGITAVDPGRTELLFERFISAERNEPPDIDVDFEHERREEVIQFIYRRYGRDHAGLAATVIRYRGRSAIRAVGKALGLSADVVGALAGAIQGWGHEGIAPERVRATGVDPADGRVRLAIALARELIGFPRHLSQHVGGFVITRGRLDEVAPVENAAMVDRTVIPWDKDDLDTLGMLKIDVLALGMLTCVRKAFDLLARHDHRRITLATVPPEDPAVYDMLCRADALGVFQVESRAQMAMLPRLKPRCFYDLVVEVAIVRPGPIQGNMVHPYLRRRNGLEAVSYPSEALRRVLGKTLGVPLFQEQAMQIAIVAAGFTPSEADRLRRAMATFRNSGDIHLFHAKMVEGMVARGYDRDFATRCFKQIEGFGTYGFPESHAASFALLVYVSSWLKCHHPAVFACALLNSQPMGFYAPAQIVRDARDHGVVVHPPDVTHSDWDCTLEPLAGSAARSDAGSDAGRSPARPGGRHALRLGLRQIKGLSEEDAGRLMAGRGPAAAIRQPYADPAALWRAGVSRGGLEALARGDAFGSLGLGRREALWAVRALGATPLPLFAAAGDLAGEPPVHLPALAIGEQVAEDYAALRLSLKCHPLALLRDRMAAAGAVPAETLSGRRDGAAVRLAGLVLVRQRPGSAKGVIFMTLEDETGVANIVVWPALAERFRREVTAGRLLLVAGRIQHRDGVSHVLAERLIDRSADLDSLWGDAGLAAPAVAAPAVTRGRPAGDQPGARHPRQVRLFHGRGSAVHPTGAPRPPSDAGGDAGPHPADWPQPDARPPRIAIRSRDFH